MKITFMGKVIPENMKHFFAFYHVKSDDKDDKEKEKSPRQVGFVTFSFCSV